MSEMPTVDPQWDNDTEDWPKRTFDFWIDGRQVETLDELEAVTGRAAEAWIPDLLHLPVGLGAPTRLIQEAMNRAGSV